MHMEAVQRDHMATYLAHYLKIAGGREELFSEEAVAAIHQSSRGCLSERDPLPVSKERAVQRSVQDHAGLT